MPASKQTVDIEGLRAAFLEESVDVAKCLAKSFRKLEELSEDDEPNKTKEFHARIAFGLIRAGAQMLKARPELAGKAAGTASGSDLLAAAVSDSGEDHSGRRPAGAELKPSPTPVPRIPMPSDGDYS